MMEDKYDKSLAKLNSIKQERYWQKLVNTDSQRSILFQGNYHSVRFSKDDILSCILKSYYLNDYDVAFKNLNEEYGVVKMDCKLYNPNLLRNGEYIDHYQQLIVILILENQKLC